jgi:hypothetical protein
MSLDTVVDYRRMRDWLRSMGFVLKTNDELTGYDNQ